VACANPKMSRHRTPTSILERNGAFDHDPQRRADREDEPIPAGPLGDPPETFTPEQAHVWDELAGQAPDGVLTSADRILVEIACRLIARLRANEPLKAAETNQIISCLARMGLTPADRSRISAKGQRDKEADDTFSRLAATGRGRGSDITAVTAITRHCSLVLRSRSLPERSWPANRSPRPASVTCPTSREARPKQFEFIFDGESAARGCEFVEAFHHVKGAWAARRERLILSAWQVFVTASLYGWVERADPTRYRFREAYICVPRKNGKTAWIAGIANQKFAADDEYSAEVYIGATSEEQAKRTCFRAARAMAAKAPSFFARSA
jgi:hypothetical protein